MLTCGAMVGGATLSAAPESMTVLILTHIGWLSSFQDTAWKGVSTNWKLSSIVNGRRLESGGDSDSGPSASWSLGSVALAGLLHFRNGESRPPE